MIKKNIIFSIAICTKDRDVVFKKTLKNLAVNSKKYAKCLEIIIVDQSKNQLTSVCVNDLFGEFKNFTVKYFNIYSKGRGLSYSRNFAIKKSIGKNIIFIDDDVFVSKNWMRVVYNLLTKYPNIEVFGGKILSYNNIETKWKYFKYFNGNGIVPLALCDLGEQSIFYPSNEEYFFVTAFLIVRRKCFQENGYFNESFGNWPIDFKPNILASFASGNKVRSGEDLEFVYRLTKRNIKMMYSPNLISHHLLSPSRITRKSFRFKYFEYGKEMAILNKIYLTDKKRHEQIYVLSSRILPNISRTISEYFFNREQNIVNEMDNFYILGYLWESMLLN